MKFNKKASLELSINAIVIIVLALTILGLSLGFARNLFMNIGQTSESITSQVKQQILDDLRTGNKKLSIPGPEMNMQRGQSQILGIGIKNTGVASMTFSINITCAAETSGSTDNPKFLLSSSFNLGAAESDVYNVKVVAPSKELGTYLCTINVIDATAGSYAQKDFFINVVG